MANTNKVYLGTEMKLNIAVDPIGTITMDDYKSPFKVEVYCTPNKKVEINSDDDTACVRVDSNNYIVLVNTDNIGVGKVKVKLIAEIPDTQFSDSYRTEVALIDTGIEIVKH